MRESVVSVPFKRGPGGVGGGLSEEKNRRDTERYTADPAVSLLPIENDYSSLSVKQ